MKLIKRPTRPTGSGSLSRYIHFALVVLIPIAIYVLVRLDFYSFALVFVILTKWRMFAVKPRHWPAFFRVNAVDVLVGLSATTFINEASTGLFQVFWVVVYGVWLLAIKPRSGVIWVGIQALTAQTLSLAAVFFVATDASDIAISLMCWGIAYLSARHFLAAYDETMARATAYAWAFFAASIGWLLSHWLIYYGPIAQPALLLSVLGYGLAAIYYLDHNDRLSKGLQRQFIGLMAIVVLFLIIFSDWSDKTI